ncbi:hypothetical protein [Aeromonas dhakensis]|uniref:hypothetical protein n=1 Tax=Aeromonas dhakensis TaxID=196024 RepID=UPI002442E04F|nr:hypothetical protein [Aeromonas dhakensis]
MHFEVEFADLKKTIEEKKKVEVELQELRERIEGTDSSNIVISERQVTLSNGNVGLFITVSVKNTGTNDIHMSWGGHTFNYLQNSL